MSMGGGPLEWSPTRAPHAAMLPARAGIGVRRPLCLPCVHLWARRADVASRTAGCPVLGHPRRPVLSACRAMPLLGDVRRHRHASCGVSNAHPVPKNSDGQSAPLRLLCSHEGQRARAAPTRAAVGPRADQHSTAVRGDAEGRYGHLSCVCGE